MKSKFFLSCLFVMSIGLTSVFGAKPTATQIAQAAARQKALVESKNYTLYLTQGSGLSGGSISISAIVRINGSEIFSSPDLAMRFQGTISDYQVTEGKKNKITVSFNAAEPGGKTYKFRFTVYYTGRVDLSTSATALDPMRYSGSIGQSSAVDTEGR